MLVPPAGLKRKELFRGVVTCFGLRAMSEVDSQKVSEPMGKNRSNHPKGEAFIDRYPDKVAPPLRTTPWNASPLMGFVWWTGLDVLVFMYHATFV